MIKPENYPAIGTCWMTSTGILAEVKEITDLPFRPGVGWFTHGPYVALEYTLNEHDMFGSMLAYWSLQSWDYNIERGNLTRV